jgi:hypothetical protein
MATYAALYAIAQQEGAFNNRLPVAVAFAAQNVLAESDQTPNHAARITWARNALADPSGMARKMIYGVLADPTLDAAWPGVSDEQVKTAVLALVDTFALA